MPPVLFTMPKKQKRPIAAAPDPDDDDDSSIASDDAFDSEDERRYGSFFEERDRAKAEGGDMDEDSEDESDDDDSDVEDVEENEVADEDESDDEDDDDDDSESDAEDEEGDGGDYMLSLLDKIDDKKRSHKDEDPSHGIATHTKESEFAASVLKKGDLTLDALMGSIQDTAGYGKVQKQLKHVAHGEATSAPVARIISERIQRKIDYEEQCKEVSQWMTAVQQNRQAETLDFRPKQRLQVTQQGLVDGFVPTTDFEKQIHAALQKAGQEDEETVLKRERDRLQDDLDANEITMDEYKKRRSDLAQMRALMFYHEQKRHHINKIKSKKYRRIRKRQRERLQGDEAELDADALKEQEEVERIKERASLAHKNTSKWAKRVLKRGNKVDVNTRKALSESLRRGDDLLKRMKSTRGGDESSDSESEDLVASAKAVLANMDDDNDVVPSGKGNALFQMAFMQKGIEKQKARAREEARELLKELEAEERDSSSDAEEQGADLAPVKKIRMSSKAEMKNVLRESELVVASLKLGQKHQVAVSGHIDIGMDENRTVPAGKVEGAKNTTLSEHSVTLDQLEVVADVSSSSRKQDAPKRPAATQSRLVADADEVNPWLADQTDNVTNKKATKKMGNALRGMVDVESAVDLLEAAPTRATTIAAATATVDNSTSKAITSLSQGELVRRAFASVADLEEDDFQKEKVRVAEQEDPTRKQLQASAKLAASKGWGSWTGAGAPPPKPPRTMPKRLQPPEKTLGKRARADEKKPNVILSEKRMKRLANNYMLAAVPYPFTSREEYEKAMSGSLGKEFNVTGAFKEMTRPAVMTRPGKVIQPISKTVKVRRSAAKF
ncbi:hypothetical protein MPSEU_000984000 [Mayamaea pseudoterrestris]|nr:hypothetical protein MPSEU_000984000 [Mayamaea pseudoterrestris]